MEVTAPFNDNLTEKKHFDAIAIRQDGAVLLSASSLTHRMWTGSVCFFEKASDAPCLSKSTASVDLSLGIGGVTDLKWVGDSAKFVATADSGAVMLFEMDGDDTIKCLAQPIEHSDIALTIDVNADRTKAVSSGNDGRVKIWDVEDFISVHTYKGHSKCVPSIACHPSNPHVFLTASQDSRLMLWDTRNVKPACIIDSSFLPHKPSSVAWDSTGNLVAFGSDSGHVALWDMASKSLKGEVATVHSRNVNRLTFSPHGSHLASASEDCTVCISGYSSAGITDIYRDNTHLDFVRCVAWAPESNAAFSCGWDGEVRKIEPKENMLTESVNGRR